MKSTSPIETPTTTPSPTESKDAARWIVGTVLCAETYAGLRYCLFKGVSLTHWPLYVNNKAIGLAGLVLLAFTYWVEWRTPQAKRAATRGFRQSIRRAGFSLTLLHVLISLPLLRPGYFPEFYAVGEDKLNLVGESCLMLGVVSLACFVALAAAGLAQPAHPETRPAWPTARGLAWIGLAAAAGHVLIFGAPRWFTPGQWPGWMPPITLLSFLAAVLPMLVTLRPGARVAATPRIAGEMTKPQSTTATTQSC